MASSDDLTASERKGLTAQGAAPSDMRSVYDAWMAWSAQQVAEHRHVERRDLLRAVDSWLERLWRSINHPGECPRNRCIPPVPKDVLRDGAVCHGRESGRSCRPSGR